MVRVDRARTTLEGYLQLLSPKSFVEAGEKLGKLHRILNDPAVPDDPANADRGGDRD